MAAVLQLTTAPIDGRQTDALPMPITGAVLGDGEYLMHSENFDEAFKAEPEEMAAQVAAIAEPSAISRRVDPP